MGIIGIRLILCTTQNSWTLAYYKRALYPDISEFADFDIYLNAALVRLFVISIIP